MIDLSRFFMLPKSFKLNIDYILSIYMHVTSSIRDSFKHYVLSKRKYCAYIINDIENIFLEKGLDGINVQHFSKCF